MHAISLCEWVNVTLSCCASPFSRGWQNYDLYAPLISNSQLQLETARILGYRNSISQAAHLPLASFLKMIASIFINYARRFARRVRSFSDVFNWSERFFSKNLTVLYILINLNESYKLIRCFFQSYFFLRPLCTYEIIFVEKSYKICYISCFSIFLSNNWCSVSGWTKQK